MAEVREYTVIINGNPTTMNLSEEDAKRLGGVPVEPKARKTRTVPNKARSAGGIK